MGIQSVKSFIRGYISASGFPSSDWDVDSWADEADTYMRAHGLTDCDDIPADVWGGMAVRFDVSDGEFSGIASLAGGSRQA